MSHPAASYAHATHFLAQFKTVVFCTRCMVIARESVCQKLVAPCTEPTFCQLTRYRKRCLRNLSMGYFPYYGRRASFDNPDKRLVREPRDGNGVPDRLAVEM